MKKHSNSELKRISYAEPLVLLVGWISDKE
jgi:hypothetical protein